MAGPLPYPYQLLSDYAKSRVSAPTPAPAPVSTSSVTVWFPPQQSATKIPPPPPPAYQLGGVWVGTIPPVGPSYGWLWLNSNNNCLYVFGDPSPGVWSQIGTNW